MKRIKLAAASMLALGMVAIAVGMSFFVVGSEASRPVMTYQDHMDRAGLYMEDGDYYKAIVSYESAASARENDQDALAGLASAYGRIGDLEKETEAREQIAELSPDNLDNQIRLIEIMIQNEEYDAAKEKTESLMKTQDSDELRSLYSNMDIEAPAFNLSSGSYDDFQLLQMTTVYNNAVVHYTTDGTEPTPDSPTYTDGIVISYPETSIRAKAIGMMGFESGETKLDFSITRQPETIARDFYHDYDNPISYLSRSLLEKSWDEEVYDYELAQIRELYILGDYRIEVEPFEETAFYDGYYKIYGTREEEFGEYDLGIVQYMPFLQTLFVGYQQGLDLTPLASLKYIKNLSLLNDGITDISPLAGLASLEHLALGWNAITDASPLSGLAGLDSLGLWNNQISDVSMLGGLTKLTYFDISHNQVSSIDSLSQMPMLSEAWINDNQIQDISPLGSCDGLVTLMQGNNPISDYGPIDGIREQLYKTDLR